MFNFLVNKELLLYEQISMDSLILLFPVKHLHLQTFFALFISLQKKGVVFEFDFGGGGSAGFFKLLGRYFLRVLLLEHGELKFINDLFIGVKIGC